MIGPSAPAANSLLRLAIVAVVAAHVLFLVYALYQLFTIPDAEDDRIGMAILGGVPFGLLFLFFAVPALSYVRDRAPLVGIILALLGLGITQWLWWAVMVSLLDFANSGDVL
jgi:hypothetical protein